MTLEHEPEATYIFNLVVEEAFPAEQAREVIQNIDVLEVAHSITLEPLPRIVLWVA